jgi:hypothetical protein
MLMFMEDYGVSIYAAGIVLHQDGRPRVMEVDGLRPASPGILTRGNRRQVRGLSAASLRRLEFIAANAAGRFRSLLTLTYHAVPMPGESEPSRNLRIARASKRDLNRFLSAVRPELGGYLWVQEFQKRGVVHYHVMCEGRPSQERIALAWTRATGQLDDPAALEHAARVDAIRSEQEVRSYLGRYLGKARQKELPDGVESAGRWWGRSKGLELSLLREVVTQGLEERFPRLVECRVRRLLRAWLRKRLGFKVIGGVLPDWRGRFAKDAVAVLDELVAFYRSQEESVA